MPNWQEFRKLLEQQKNVVIVPHHRPDPDCLGSALALAHLLETFGCNATVVQPQATPPGYLFLDPESKMRVIDEEGMSEFCAAADCIVLVDTSAWAQLGAMREHVEKFEKLRVVVDHHEVGDADLEAEFFTDSKIPATAELVAGAYTTLEVPLTEQVATWLYAGIVTDSGWFRFPAVTAETYRTTALLVLAGASPPQVYKELHEQEPISRLHLMGAILSRIKSLQNGRIAYTYLDWDDFERLGSHPSESEDLINILLTADTVEVAVLLVGLKAGGYKASFRSQCTMNCAQLAKKFDGGGHAKAAGATLHTNRDEAIAQVMAQTEKDWKEKA